MERLNQTASHATDNISNPRGEGQLESKLIELKASHSAIDATRIKLEAMGAERQGTYSQEDIYFNVPKGRLKIRRVEGEKTSKLVYYEREDRQEPKISDVLIVDTDNPDTLKVILQRSLGTRVTITKTREIYLYQGTQIHLDHVEDLGTFIEFERKVSSLPKDRRVLEGLMKTLGIKQEDLLRRSYSDIKLFRKL